MTLLIVLASVAAYLTAAAYVARNRLQRWAHRACTNRPRYYGSELDADDRVFYALGAFAFGLAWPITLTFLAIGTWLWKPYDRAAARRNQLQDDLHTWEKKLHTAQGNDRQIALEVVKALRDSLQVAP